MLLSLALSLVACGACENGKASDGDGGVDSGSDADTDSDTDTECSYDDTFDESDCQDLGSVPECTVYVDGDADSGGDGLSWETALLTVQDGIDLARCGVLDDDNVCEQWQVWVKQGTYYIHQGCREHVVRLRPFVGLYGGFDGTESSLGERDWEANETVLDGRDGPDGQNHVYHVVFGSDDALLDGFTITGGRAEHEDHPVGAGFMTVDTAAEVSNCAFTDNSATYCGGAMYVVSVDSPMRARLSNTRFVANEAELGGAVFMQNVFDTIDGCEFVENEGYIAAPALLLSDCSVDISDCTITENSIGDDYMGGGGAIVLWGGNYEVSGSDFSGNSGWWGGGLAAMECDIDVIDCSFADNFATNNGGGLSINSGTGDVVDCIFFGNSTDYMGGGCAFNDSYGTFTGCVFEQNSASCGGGAASVPSGFETVLSNNRFVGNTADVGAGLYSISFDSDNRVVNCTFVDNASSAGGGAVYGDGVGSGLNVTNSVLWGNSPFEVGHLDLEVTPVVTYSVVQGGYLGAGNLDEDPLLDTELTPQTGSPCIDAADGDAAPELDMAGNPRVDDPDTPNTGTGDPPYADMGAYEYQPGKGGE